MGGTPDILRKSCTLLGMCKTCGTNTENPTSEDLIYLHASKNSAPELVAEGLAAINHVTLHGLSSGTVIQTTNITKKMQKLMLYIIPNTSRRSLGHDEIMATS